MGYIDAMMIATLLKSGRYSKAHVSEEVYANIKALYRHKESLQDELKKHLVKRSGRFSDDSL